MNLHTTKVNHKMIVYSIINQNKDCIYVGSTKNTIVKRKNLHKQKAKEQPERLLYKYIIENGGWDCFAFEILEECNEDLKQVERKWFDKLNPICNIYRPIISKEEDMEHRRQRAIKYYYDDIENKKQKHRDWYNENKDEYNARRRKNKSTE